MSIDLRKLAGPLRPVLWKDRLSLESDLYCPGLYAYDWHYGRDLKPCGPWEYETALEAFFSRNPGLAGKDADNIVIIKGGIGTGKSTAIDRAMRRASQSPRECSRMTGNGLCASVPRILVLDFRTKDEATEAGNQPDAETDLDLDEFWTYVSQSVRLEEDEDLGEEQEVTAFWKWCLAEAVTLELSPTLYRELLAIKPRIDMLLSDEKEYQGWSREQVFRGLLGVRENLLREKLSTEELAWYDAFKLAYVSLYAARPCRCSYLFLDNVDQLLPHLQRIAVDLAVRLSEMIPARTIIAVRPLTWERSIHGQYLINEIKHRSPSISSVLSKRVTRFLAANKPDLAANDRRALGSLLSVMAGRRADPVLGRLLGATAGLSVRFALRNFHNMLESDSLMAVPERGGAVRKMQMSHLTRAFFCGERTDLIPHCFENLYAVGEKKDQERWLVKPRILELLAVKSEGQEGLRHLFGTMQKFDCTEEVFSTAMTELMLRKRPLVWCEDGYHCTNPASAARVSLTPIGKRYINELFGEVFYDELCIPWGHVGIDGVRGVYEFHRLLTQRDLEEARRAKLKYGARFYFGLFPIERPGVSFRHAENMMKGLIYRAKRDDFYDPKRVEWVRDLFQREVGPAPDPPRGI